MGNSLEGGKGAVAELLQRAKATLDADGNPERPDPQAGLYAKGSYSDRERILHLVRTAVLKLRYLKQCSYSKDGPLGSMISLSLCPNHMHISREAMRADLERLWAAEVSAHANCVHNFIETDEAISIRFAIMDEQGYFVTGTVTVLEHL